MEKLKATQLTSPESELFSSCSCHFLRRSGTWTSVM